MLFNSILLEAVILVLYVPFLSELFSLLQVVLIFYFTNAAEILVFNALIFEAIIKLLILIYPRILEITVISSFHPDVIVFPY